MSARRTASTLVAALAPALLVGAAARAAEYTFANLVDTRGEFAGFGVPAAMNNDGTVALVAFNDGFGRGVFAGRPGGPLVTIVPFNTLADDDNFPGPAINDAGTVVFSRWNNRDNVGALVAAPATGGPSRTITDTTAGPFHFLGARPDVNNVGTVAFAGGHRDHGLGVYTLRENGTVTPVATGADGYTGFLQFVAMNNAGEVAFMAESPAGRSMVLGAADGSLRPLDASDGTVIGFGQTFGLNDAGTLVYKAYRGNLESHGIYTSSGSGRALVADTAGAYNFLEHPFINNAGTVVFEGLTDAGVDGVFTGPDPLTDKVIAAGDPLFGSTVRSAAPVAFNDAGQIAIYYGLPDGTQGILVATPVPEPASAAVLAATPTALLLRRRGRGG